MAQWVRVEFNSDEAVLIGESAHEREWVLDVRNVAEGTLGRLGIHGENGETSTVLVDSGDSRRVAVNGTRLSLTPDFRGQVAEYSHA